MNGLISLFRSINRYTLAAGLGASLALAGPALASAQDDGGAPAFEGRRGHGHRGHHRGMHFGRMAGELGLTEAQQARMRNVMAEAREERQLLRELAPEERRAAAQALHERIRGQMQAILTPEQRARAEARRAEHRERRGERRLERMQERLDLSASQATQVRTILERSQAQRAELRASGDREAMRALRERTQSAIRGVLTPAQQSQLDAQRAERGERGHRGHRGPRGGRPQR